MKTQVRSALTAIVGKSGISEDPEDRISYARDLWPRGLILTRGGKPAENPPDAIVWPRSAEEVQKIVRFCRKENLFFVPFGAGSGVCGGTVPLHGGISIDTKRMRRVLFTDAKAGIARVECGIIGEVLEESLNRKGLTLGHFPSSIYCSTLGGFLAARSAGQLSTRYGKIEDMVASAQAVLASGEIVELSQQKPDLLQSLVGAEGTLGLFTQATLRVHPLAESRLLRGIRFPDIPSGLLTIRTILQSGIRPAVVRLYDELDTLIALSGKKTTQNNSQDQNSVWNALKKRIPQDKIARAAASFAFKFAPSLGGLLDIGPKLLKAGCLLILALEGKETLTKIEEQEILTIAKKHGGEDLGEGPGENWLAKRYAVSYRLSKVFDAGAFADTIEVATTWDNLFSLYEHVRDALAKEATVMAHFSHAYHEGCSIYFTFSSSAPSMEASLARYDRIWQRALDAVLQAGASSSHHHGIGILKARHLRRELGEGGNDFLDALKKGLDPDRIANPGKLGFSV